MDDDSLPLGCDITRAELRARFGGPTQGAISPSKTSGRIMLFTGSPTDATDLEGWGSDGCYHFMGLGASGNQVMKQGNRSLANHKQEARELHLFILAPHAGNPRLYRYVGQFELDPSNPHYKADAVDRNGIMRSVIIFRLRPVGKVSTYGPRLAVTPAQELTIQAAPLRLPRESASRLMRPSTARTEGLLLQEYAHHLRTLGCDVSQMQINIAGEAGALAIDLIDKTENRLIEVKANATRAAVRGAIGALMDYRRFINPTPRLAVLVPDKPREDLLDLCASLCIEVIWRGETGGFVSSDD